jgi:ADP-ribosylation factor GTPase-activating protein 1
VSVGAVWRLLWITVGIDIISVNDRVLVVGGKYAGFGSAPEPAPSSSHPSFALSSHNAPSLQEFQQAPLQALSKGWSLFSSAVAVAGTTINDSVIQPGVARAGEVVSSVNERGIGAGYGGVGANNTGTGSGPSGRDLSSKLLEEAKATGGWLSSVAGEGWSNLNTLAKEKGGLDLNEQLGKLGIKGSSSTGGNNRNYPGYEFEYGQLDRAEGGNEDDFFHQHGGYTDAPSSSTAAPPKKDTPPPAKEKPTKGDGWDDEWKDF